MVRPVSILMYVCSLLILMNDPLFLINLLSNLYFSFYPVQTNHLQNKLTMLQTVRNLHFSIRSTLFQILKIITGK
jgi:hypothetical protein